ncbi:hypothetical protein [Paenibacillus sp. YAF4_2]|uniref:hypothetical protein n=1 Tax=Paenibacillus sp. YAF4_2 TaxID=3233085 RepID=UPI003F979E46
MIQATFFLDSSTKEDSKVIIKQFLSSRIDNKSFTIVANEMIQNEYGKFGKVTCEFTKFKTPLDYSSAISFLNSFTSEWNWSFHSASTTALEIYNKTIEVPLFYLTALNDGEAGLDLYVMADSVGDPPTVLRDLIELTAYSGEYSILECTEYWKIDGCYEVGATLKTSGMAFEDYLTMLNKWSKQWSFTGLQAATDLNE